MKKRILSLALALCMALALLPGAAFAEAPEVVTIQAPRSIAELNAKWEALKPVHTSGSSYVKVPEMSPWDGGPTLGEVKTQVLMDGLNTMNFARYMVGMTGDVSLVKDFSTNAQYASALLAFRDDALTHTPKRPEGVSDEFYKRGLEGTSNSCIYRKDGSQATCVADSVRGYLTDSGSQNEDKGHRSSVLNPSTTGIGFGMATALSGRSYSAMWDGYGLSLNGTGTKTTNYEAITWPAPGYHATYFFPSGTAWSVRLNGSRYDTKQLDNIKVTVTGPNGTAVVPHHIGQYQKMIIFTPSGSTQAGNKYTVEISGLYRNGKPATLKYSVVFFELGAAADSTAEQLDADKVAIESVLKSFSLTGSNYTTAEDVLNCAWSATRYIEKIEWVSAPTITKATSSKTGSFKGTLRYSLNGTSRTYDVNITIMKHSSKDNLYRGIAAAKAMPVTASTTKADIEKFVTARLTDGCTATLSDKPLIKAPTATKTGYVNYKLIVKDSKGKTINSCGITQIIPIPGREKTNVITYTANPTNDKLSVDGQPKTPAAYKINGSNYFQLRDVALLLNGTKAQFSVDYDASRKAVLITTGKPYTPNGTEGKGPATGKAQAIAGNNDVYINGAKVDFTVYKINGANFFQIRDLGRKLGFNVDWTAERGMFIESDKPYSG